MELTIVDAEGPPLFLGTFPLSFFYFSRYFQCALAHHRLWSRSRQPSMLSQNPFRKPGVIFLRDVGV